MKGNKQHNAFLGRCWSLGIAGRLEQCYQRRSIKEAGREFSNYDSRSTNEPSFILRSTEHFCLVFMTEIDKETERLEMFPCFQVLAG